MAQLQRSGASADNFYDPKRLEAVFSECFFAEHNTRLEGGFDEPLYLPPSAAGPGSIQYREDYFASALHEVAHWCIAGEQRRRQRDYGYWYAPDGRSDAQQKAFEAVEYQPQALEWFFARACHFPFQVSADNLNPQTGEIADAQPFKQRIVAQALKWRSTGLPGRGQLFYQQLCCAFGGEHRLEQLDFQLSELG